MAKTAATAAAGLDTVATDIHKTIDENGQRNDQLLRAEIESFVARAAVNRDLELALIVGSDESLEKAWKGKYYDARMGQLGIDRKKACKGMNGELLTAIGCVALHAQRSRRAGASIAEYQTDLRSYGYAADVSCDKAPPTIDEKAVKNAAKIGGRHALEGGEESIRHSYATLIKKCNERRQLQSELAASSKAVADRLAEEQAAQSAAAEAAGHAKAIAAEYEQAATALKDATETASGTPPSEAIQAAQDDIQSALGAAGELTSALKLSTIQAKLDIIGAVLKAARSGKTEDIDGLKGRSAQAAALVISALPVLADNVSEIKHLLEGPHLTPLIIVTRRLEALKNEAVALKLADDAQVVLSSERTQALLDELREYDEVRSLIETSEYELKAAKIRTCALCFSAANLFSLKGGRHVARAKTAMRLAIARQTAAQWSGYVRDQRAKLEDISLQYLTANIQSRSAVDQWLALIGPLVAQQKEYHEGGIAPDSIASLMVEIAKAVGLFSIAGSK